MKPAYPALAGMVLAVCAGVCAAAPASDISIRVSVARQKLYLVRDGRQVRVYDISTSKYGTGNKLGSLQTPLGRHRIARKIGAGAPLNTIFRNRVDLHRIASVDRTLEGAPEDLITTRILWLAGLERGLNQGGRIDSFRRLIYIHGTPSEGLIGRPASNGCVRMRNQDVIDLFDRVAVGTPVIIEP